MRCDSGYPKVSVIIPCYNRRDFIAETVESVLRQTWPNIELIVVDDGSTDGSREILESFGSKLQLMEHPGRANRGQSAAINLGIEACTGEYVAILDSDDLFAPQKIEKQVTFLIDHPEIGLVYANGNSIDVRGNVLYKFYDKDHSEPSFSARILLDCYFLIPNNSLIRKSVFASSGLFDEDLRAAQDHDMAIRISEVARIAYIPECLFYYRRHKDSISFKNVKTRWQNGYRILWKACRRHRYPLKIILGRLAVLNFRMAQCHLEEKQYVKAAMYLLAAGLTDPLRSIRVLLGIESVSSHH
jgi:Glycosyltransferases, probably involved in cell wall biogenesis